MEKIRIHGRLVSGYRQTIKAIETGNAKLVFLANDCNENNYKALINAVAKKAGVAVCTKFQRKELGELSGQFRMRGDITKQRMGKVHLASTVAITEFSPKFNEEDKNAFNALLQ